MGDEVRPGEPLITEPDGALYRRELDDGFEVTVWAMTYGKGRLCYGRQESMTYEDAYCYPSHNKAIEAAKVWDGEGDPPDGWTRHPMSGRRREDGDPEKETVYR